MQSLMIFPLMLSWTSCCTNSPVVLVKWSIPKCGWIQTYATALIWHHCKMTKIQGGTLLFLISTVTDCNYSLAKNCLYSFRNCQQPRYYFWYEMAKHDVICQIYFKKNNGIIIRGSEHMAAINQCPWLDKLCIIYRRSVTRWPVS